MTKQGGVLKKAHATVKKNSLKKGSHQKVQQMGQLIQKAQQMGCGPEPIVDPTLFVILNKIATTVIDRLDPIDDFSVRRRQDRLAISVNEVKCTLNISDSDVELSIGFSPMDGGGSNDVWSDYSDPQLKFNVAKPTMFDEIVDLIIRAKSLRKANLLAKTLGMELPIGAEDPLLLMQGQCKSR